MDIQKDKTYKVLSNQDNTLDLYYKMALPLSSFATRIDYYVVDRKTKKVLKKDIVVGESITWADSITLGIVPFTDAFQKEGTDEVVPESPKTKNLILVKIK